MENIIQNLTGKLKHILITETDSKRIKAVKRHIKYLNVLGNLKKDALSVETARNIEHQLTIFPVNELQDGCFKLYKVKVDLFMKAVQLTKLYIEQPDYGKDELFCWDT